MRANISATVATARMMLIGFAATAFTAVIARGQDSVVASFKGGQQGAICGSSSTNPLTLQSFEETTTGSRDQSTGNVTGAVRSTYSLSLPTLCAAPFFKAITNNEVLSVD